MQCLMMAKIVLKEFAKELFDAMFDDGKDCFKRICKGIEINKNCCNFQVVAVMVTDRQGFSAVTNAFTTVNDR